MSPTQPPATDNGYYTFVGYGACLPADEYVLLLGVDASESHYIVAASSTLNEDTNSVNKCGSICTESAASSGEFLVGFELTPGVSCNCLLFQNTTVPQASGEIFNS